MTSLIVFDFLDSPTQATETTGINFEKAFLFISPAAEMREMCDRSLRESSQLILKALFIDSIFSLIESSHFISIRRTAVSSAAVGRIFGPGGILWDWGGHCGYLAFCRCWPELDVLNHTTLSAG